LEESGVASTEGNGMSVSSTLRGFVRARRLVLALVSGALLFGVLAPSNASASAYGVQYWAGFNVNILGQTVKIPTGQLAHQVSGSGTYINSEWAHITTGPGFCNWRVDYVYSDVYNTVYRRIGTATQYGCDTWAYAPTVYPGRVRAGKACAHLYRSGAYVTKQCHSIF
jgi:hypothetical protein